MVAGEQADLVRSDAVRLGRNQKLEIASRSAASSASFRACRRGPSNTETLAGSLFADDETGDLRPVRPVGIEDGRAGDAGSLLGSECLLA